MSDEQVTERVIERRGGGMGIVLAVLLLIGAAAVAYFVFDIGKSEKSKDDAISRAADKVGEAADKAGDAIDKATGN